MLNQEPFQKKNRQINKWTNLKKENPDSKDDGTLPAMSATSQSGNCMI